MLPLVVVAGPGTTKPVVDPETTINTRAAPAAGDVIIGFALFAIFEYYFPPQTVLFVVAVAVAAAVAGRVGVCRVGDVPGNCKRTRWLSDGLRREEHKIDVFDLWLMTRLLELAREQKIAELKKESWG